MTHPPAGWYPDRNPTHYAPQGQLRYWDGQQWTEHVQAPQQPAMAPMPPAPMMLPLVPTTPDGQPISGWWKRVLATVLDGFISMPLTILAVAPVVASQWDELDAWFAAVKFSVKYGTPMPDDPAILDPFSAPGITITLLALAVALVYQVGFLRWKQATPGKLILGLRIRRRETPGPLPWPTILIRVCFVLGLSVGAQIPILGAVFFLPILLNYLWPLWDNNRQALHDKLAGTNVVLTK